MLKDSLTYLLEPSRSTREGKYENSSATISATISELMSPLIATDIADFAWRQMKRLRTAGQKAGSRACRH